MSHTQHLGKNLDRDPSSLDAIKQAFIEHLYVPEIISCAEHEIVKKRGGRWKRGLSFGISPVFALDLLGRRH